MSTRPLNLSGRPRWPGRPVPGQIQPASGQGYPVTRAISRLGSSTRCTDPSILLGWIDGPANFAASCALLVTCAQVGQLLIRQQTAVINALRAHLAEFGIVAPVGRHGVEELLRVVADPSDKRVPEVARACLAALGAQLRVLKAQILEFDRMINAWHRSSETSKRLDKIPGVGPALATALIASVADPKAFRSGRDFSAWIGLVPHHAQAAHSNRPRHSFPERYFGIRYLLAAQPAERVVTMRWTSRISVISDGRRFCMGKQRLQLVRPTTVNRTVTPRRLPNAQLRTREHLTEREVERLIDAAKGIANGCSL